MANMFGASCGQIGEPIDMVDIFRRPMAAGRGGRPGDRGRRQIGVAADRRDQRGGRGARRGGGARGREQVPEARDPAAQGPAGRPLDVGIGERRDRPAPRRDADVAMKDELSRIRSRTRDWRNRATPDRTARAHPCGAGSLGGPPRPSWPERRHVGERDRQIADQRAADLDLAGEAIFGVEPSSGHAQDLDRPHRAQPATAFERCRRALLATVICGAGVDDHHDPLAVERRVGDQQVAVAVARGDQDRVARPRPSRRTAGWESPSSPSARSRARPAASGGYRRRACLRRRGRAGRAPGRGSR